MQDLKAYAHMVLASIFLLLFLPSVLYAFDKKQGILIEPDIVVISSFFSGVQMHITCDLPTDCQAVLSIRGKRIEAELMRKSHQWELWINRGEVDIDKVPVLYIALSSSPHLLSRSPDNFPWGYDALEKEARFSGRLKPSEDVKVFNEFIQLKERYKLYQLYPGDLKVDRLNSDQWNATADFRLPSRIKPGMYYVTLWVIRDHSVVEQRDNFFEVRLRGLPRLLNSLAMEHGIIYGFMAVMIAMLAGIITGLAFHHRVDGH